MALIQRHQSRKLAELALPTRVTAGLVGTGYMKFTIKSRAGA